jgi:hypothetical protein
MQMPITSPFGSCSPHAPSHQQRHVGAVGIYSLLGALLLQTIGQDLFGEFTCLSPCFGGYECLYQSAYLGPCASPDSRWLWDNSTQHLRQQAQPDICLTMCPTQVRSSPAGRSPASGRRLCLHSACMLR